MSYLVLKQVLISWHVTVHLRASTHLIACDDNHHHLPRITIMRQPLQADRTFTTSSCLQLSLQSTMQRGKAQ